MYSYEDFLQGFRPRTTVEGGLTHALQDGTFKRFCDRARARTGPCVLVIESAPIVVRTIDMGRIGFPQAYWRACTLRHGRSVAYSLFECHSRELWLVRSLPGPRKGRPAPPVGAPKAGRRRPSA